MLSPCSPRATCTPNWLVNGTEPGKPTESRAPRWTRGEEPGAEAVVLQAGSQPNAVISLMMPLPSFSPAADKTC